MPPLQCNSVLKSIGRSRFGQVTKTRRIRWNRSDVSRAVVERFQYGVSQTVGAVTESCGLEVVTFAELMAGKWGDGTKPARVGCAGCGSRARQTGLGSSEHSWGPHTDTKFRDRGLVHGSARGERKGSTLVVRLEDHGTTTEADRARDGLKPEISLSVRGA